jgi:hypothetical protein
MPTLHRLTIALAAAALGSVALVSGCYAEADVPAATVTTSGDVVAGYGYEPAYYDGYLVYYDGVGRPFYYGPSGGVIWIAPTSPYYGGLVAHWHHYGPAYNRWNGNYGARYHGYRAAPGYNSYHGYHGAPHGGGHHR